ncbi:MAG TPA: SCO family protein [Steroidobacteraceae bacterium]
MTFRSSWLTWGLAAAVAALGGFLLARQLDRPAFELASGTWFPEPKPVSEFSLVDHTGKPFTVQELRGQPTLVFFGFTHCPDVCPTTLAQLAKIKQAAGIADLRVLLLSVDPERDTPEALSQYVHAFDPQFVGATGKPEEIEKMARRFGVAMAKVPLPGGSYTMDHSAAIFLLDDQARIVAVFTPPFDTAKFAADLQHAEDRLRS